MIRLGLKVDVDTYEGMRNGVPNMLKLFRGLDIKASFYIPFGPDESGKAVFRVFKKKGFLKKMSRTNPLKLYGIRTMLRGTLLPAPMIGSSFPEIARAVIAEGHELGIHGYNHVLWQDHLTEMTEKEVREQFERGVIAYEKAVGVKPRAFAAPAWLATPESLKFVDRFGFDYASDARGRTPFLPSMGGQSFQTLQIPSTLPTTDEVLGTEGMDDAATHRSFTRLMETSPLEAHIHTIHTEVEGTALLPAFSAWLEDLKRKDVSFFRLCDWAAALSRNRDRIPRGEIVLDNLPGRAGKVACQK